MDGLQHTYLHREGEGEIFVQLMFEPSNLETLRRDLSSLEKEKFIESGFNDT